MKNNLYRFVSGDGHDLVVHVEASDKTELARRINAEFLDAIDTIPFRNHQHRVITLDGDEFRTLRLRRWLVQNA
jgi:hypothetical protein